MFDLSFVQLAITDAFLSTDYRDDSGIMIQLSSSRFPLDKIEGGTDSSGGLNFIPMPISLQLVLF